MSYSNKDANRKNCSASQLKKKRKRVITDENSKQCRKPPQHTALPSFDPKQQQVYIRQ